MRCYRHHIPAMKKNNSQIASFRPDILAQPNRVYKNDNYSHSHNRNASRISRRSKQLNLWESPQNPVPEAQLFRRKPQVSSIPGIPLKERHRYRVTSGGEVLGDFLSLDEAIELAKRGMR